jgi:CheY-like chemotaxis protein
MPAPVRQLLLASGPAQTAAGIPPPGKNGQTELDDRERSFSIAGMNLGLVTPPGVLGQFVARTLEPAGHRLWVAPDLRALLEQTQEQLSVVLFAPVVDGQPATRVLQQARSTGVAVNRAVYLGLDAQSCEEARRSGFFGALQVPFQAQELVAAVESSVRGRLRVLLADDSELIHKHTVPILAAAGYDVDEAWDDGRTCS